MQITKISRLFGMLLASFIFLSGCVNNSLYTNNPDCLSENWMSHINLNTNSWTHNADRWFFTGDANRIDHIANEAPDSRAMSIMTVNVSSFNNIYINGDFQVQITSTNQQDSIFVLGSNHSMRQVSVRVCNNTLHVEQDPNANPAEMRNVVVRISLHDLRKLDVNGSAKVEGRNIFSDGLMIRSTDCNLVLLAGQICLTQIKQLGAGTVTVMGAYARNASIIVVGDGNVNVSGKLGIRCIEHAGCGVVNIIGIDSPSLDISTSGKGLTAIAGCANLRTLAARGGSCVYLYWVSSQYVNVTECDNATVGLAGHTHVLNVDLIKAARFEGKYLKSDIVTVKTSGTAHANVTPIYRIFASASDWSSIYYFGRPGYVARYGQEHGQVLAV